MNKYAAFEVGEGWNQLCKDMTDELQSLENGEVVIGQVKSKYAELRVYYYAVGADNVDENTFLAFNEKVEEIIKKYKQIAAQTCEYCGSMEDVAVQVKYSWHTNLCKKCRKEEE